MNTQTARVSRARGLTGWCYRDSELTALEALPLASCSRNFPRSTNEIRIADVSKKSMVEWIWTREGGRKGGREGWCIEKRKKKKRKKTDVGKKRAACT